jgi:hypothetical protein
MYLHLEETLARAKYKNNWIVCEDASWVRTVTPRLRRV